MRCPGCPRAVDVPAAQTQPQPSAEPAANPGAEPDTATTADPVLICGEIRTRLLPASRPLSGAAAAELLALRTDERVRVSERPNHYAVSPDVLTGVDVRLPADLGPRVRAVGTLAARAVLTGGRVLQSSARFHCQATGPDRRQPWGHYLLRPGAVEPIGSLQAAASARSFLAGASRADGPDLGIGVVAERLPAALLRHRLLDQRPPFRAAQTRLRWAAWLAADGEGPSIESFTLAEDGLRTVALRVPPGTPPIVVAALCEDLALHDWLLTTLARMVDRAESRAAVGPTVVTLLRPAIEHLVHLWLPGARVDPGLDPVWATLERSPAFSRQWLILVQRVRDQLALHSLPMPPGSALPDPAGHPRPDTPDTTASRQRRRHPPRPSREL